MWAVPRALDALLNAGPVMSFISSRMRAGRAAGTHLLGPAHCDALAFDPFHSYFGDEAARLGVPAVGLLLAMPLFTQPPFALLPLSTPLTLGAGAIDGSTRGLAEVAADAVAAVVTPLVESSVLALEGWRMHGYPRSLMAALYGARGNAPARTCPRVPRPPTPTPPPAARPFLSLTALSSGFGAAPASVIHLGPPYAATAAAAAGSGRLLLPGVSAAAGGRIAVDVPCSASRPLVVAPGRLLLAAYGTNVRVPLERSAALCAAFTAVLDAGAADAVLFARRPLLFEDDAGSMARSCAPGGVLPECGDPRIWSVSWAPQRAALASGAVSAFLTHGGYSSVNEAFAARVPVAVMPVFADQPLQVRGGLRQPPAPPLYPTARPLCRLHG